MRFTPRSLVMAAGFCFLAPAALALQQPPLPKEIAGLPFEIRDGYQRFVARCTTCHDAKRVESAKKSLFEWHGVIGEMSQKKGADIPIADRQPIFYYLSYLHGISGTPEEKEQYLTFLRGCEDCHGISIVYKEKQPMMEWPKIVHRMAGKDRAKISPEDETKIMGYIRRMHPDLFGVE
jgi:cytochrome c peroxidase